MDAPFFFTSKAETTAGRLNLIDEPICIKGIFPLLRQRIIVGSVTPKNSHNCFVVMGGRAGLSVSFFGARELSSSLMSWRKSSVFIITKLSIC